MGENPDAAYGQTPAGYASRAPENGRQELQAAQAMTPWLPR